MGRRNGPDLYELLARAKEGGGASSSRPSRAQGPAFDRAQLGWIVGLVAVLAAIVVAYLVGVSRGERSGRAALAAERAEELRLLEEGRPAGGASAGALATGPGAGQSALPVVDVAAPASENGIASAESRATNPPEGGLSTENGMGRDPRVAGLNYFVIASGVLEERVPEILSFCRSKGLDAWVVPDQNGRLREITVLPGFEGGRRSDPDIKDLEAKIRRVGVLWKAAGRNNQDFAGAYPKRFNG